MEDEDATFEFSMTELLLELVSTAVGTSDELTSFSVKFFGSGASKLVTSCDRGSVEPLEIVEVVLAHENDDGEEDTGEMNEILL